MLIISLTRPYTGCNMGLRNHRFGLDGTLLFLESRDRAMLLHRLLNRLLNRLLDLLNVVLLLLHCLVERLDVMLLLLLLLERLNVALLLLETTGMGC